MANIKDVLEGIKIIMKYTRDEELEGENFHINRDQIYILNYSDEKIKLYNPDDLEKLKVLGWFGDQGFWSTFV